LYLKYMEAVCMVMMGKCYLTEDEAVMLGCLKMQVCCVMLCYAVLCCAVLCCAVLCCAIRVVYRVVWNNMCVDATWCHRNRQIPATIIAKYTQLIV
jgi:hypothetical protein